LSQIFQEYAAARSAIFLYGGRHLSSDIMSQVLLVTKNLLLILLSIQFDLLVRKESLDYGNWVDVLSVAPDLSDDIAGHSSVYYMMGYQCKKKYCEEIITSLSHSRNCKASDKRYHIYTFLGLTDNLYGLPVDYGPKNNPEILFTQQAGRMVEKDKDLTILSYVGARNKTRMNGLPS
jgi:hypothetical protein